MGECVCVLGGKGIDGTAERISLRLKQKCANFAGVQKNRDVTNTHVHTHTRTYRHVPMLHADGLNSCA